eukprot:3017484-Pleurochrysis_carterae.AAC.1
MPMLAYGGCTTLQTSAVLFGCPHRFFSLEHQLTFEPRLPRDAEIERAHFQGVRVAREKCSDSQAVDLLFWLVSSGPSGDDPSRLEDHAQLCTRERVHNLALPSDMGAALPFLSPPF